jgi:hypothetical protein
LDTQEDTEQIFASLAAQDMSKGIAWLEMTIKRQHIICTSMHFLTNRMADF